VKGIELVRRSVYRTPRQRRRDRIVTSLCLLLLFLAWFAWLAFALPQGALRLALKALLGITAQDWIDFGRRLWRKDPASALMLPFLCAVMIVQALWHWRAPKHERLIFDDLGVRYLSPLPGILQPLWPNWSLAWDDIKRIKLHAPSLRSAFPTLRIESGGRPRSIRVLEWIDPQTFVASSGSLFRTRAAILQAAREDIQANPIFRFLAARGYEFDLAGLQAGIAGFALEKNPRSLAVVIAFFVLIGYALVDFLIGAETYAIDAPWPLIFAAGTCAAIAALAWMKHGKVPWAESIAVAALVGAAFGAALYPGLLRVNRLTSVRALQCYEYISQGNGRLAAPDASLPELYFAEPRDYWTTIPTGTAYPIWLRRGAFVKAKQDTTPSHEGKREQRVVRPSPGGCGQHRSSE
jgi:hypothetical protein